MSKEYILFYQSEEIDRLTPAERQKLASILTSSKRPASIEWKGNVLETRKLTIQAVEEVKQDDYRLKYIKEWEKEQERLKNESVIEKVFRNYKCKFCWQYLLAVGFTRFFESEDWKKWTAETTFKRFDERFSKTQPNRYKHLIEDLETFFKNNPNAIWADEIVNKYIA